MELLSGVAGTFPASLSLKFLSIIGHVSGSIEPIILIWLLLESFFPPAEFEYS